MKKILPPFLFMMFVVIMGGICWGMGSLHNVIYPFTLIGLPFIVAGLLLAIVGKRLFRRLGANIMTFDEPSALITDGVYKYTRNPMYLGFVIAMAGFSLLMGAAVTSFLIAGLFFIITDRWYIVFEEKAMHHKFGLEYEEYCREVRRWI